MGDYLKAYRLKIDLDDIYPNVWRRIVVPEKISFQSFHEIIQICMGWSNLYLYDFNIKEENIRITSDEEAILEYDMYYKLKQNGKNDPYGYIEHMTKMQPRLSYDVKIDYYLTKWKHIEYIYDFGDYWRHTIILEEIIENYKLDYPICFDGEGISPYEDTKLNKEDEKINKEFNINLINSILKKEFSFNKS